MARRHYLDRCRFGPEVFILFLVLVSCLDVNCIKESPHLVRSRKTSGQGLVQQVESVARQRVVKRDAGLITEAPTPAATTAAAAAGAATYGCPITCHGIKQRPVCASDGVTYSSKCELRRLRDCDKKEGLRVVSKGRCAGETKCQEERRTAKFELLQRPANDVYIPECKADGSFREMQCHIATGYCWCVTSDGKPIPGSSVEGHNTDCARIGRQKLRNYAGGPKIRRGVGAKECGIAERSIFNTNLIKRFNEEYMRAPRPEQHSMDVTYKSTTSTAAAANGTAACQGDSCTQRRVVEWKFSELDLDKDAELKRKELKTLRYLVNKLIEPHSCAVSFLEYCGLDTNKRIALSEWSECLRVVPAVASNSSFSTQKPFAQRNRSSSATQKKERHKQRVKPEPSKTPKVIVSKGKATDIGPKRVHPRMPLKATFFDLKSRTKQNLTPTGSRIRPPESEQKNIQQEHSSPEGSSKLRACEEERQKAVEMDRADPDGHIFVPECESNGLFKKAQCHNSTGYCWCVEDKTGVPIPGFSTHNVTPDCSDVRTNGLKGTQKPFAQRKKKKVPTATLR